MRWLLFLLLFFPGFAQAAESNIATTSRDQVSLISQTNAPVNGKITLALHFRLASGWHIYWSNPGDAGLTPQIALDPPAQAGALQFPPPEFYLQAGVAAYVLSGDVMLPFVASGVGNTVSATAQWLVCSNVCVPEHAHFSLNLPGGAASAQAALFKPSPLVTSPFAARIASDGTLSIAGPARQQVNMAHFFPFAPTAIVNGAPQRLGFDTGGITLKLTPGTGFTPGQSLSGVLQLTDPNHDVQALILTAMPGPAAASSLVLWLGFALLGGLLLNLMPCVFPVLAMKAANLARLGAAARHEVRREAALYTAGVLVAMLALGAVLLGLRALGGDFGWGFQFQSPIFIAVIAWLIFTAGLNLAGVFEIANMPVTLQRHGAFFSGLFAVIAATPCTAPFMGGAIAAALAGPPVAAFGVFLCLGLGLAAPFLLLALCPSLAGLLPRPGAWMVILQRLLSLPMFGAALWLAWVMLREAGTSGLLLLLLGAACLAAALAVRRLRLVALAALLVLPFLHPVQAGDSLLLPNAEAYTPHRLAALRAANQPVLVDMTAAWCITCLVNDRTTLAQADVQNALADTKTKLLVGDWTRRNPDITEFLQQNGRDGVPLYVYYPAGGTAITLPQVLTPGMVKQVLN